MLIVSELIGFGIDFFKIMQIMKISCNNRKL